MAVFPSALVFPGAAETRQRKFKVGTSSVFKGVMSTQFWSQNRRKGEEKRRRELTQLPDAFVDEIAPGKLPSSSPARVKIGELLSSVHFPAHFSTSRISASKGIKKNSS